MNHPEVTSRLIERFIRYAELHPSMDDYRGKLIVVEADRIRLRQ